MGLHAKAPRHLKVIIHRLCQNVLDYPEMAPIYEAET